jgi:hypothetical protein
MSRSVFIVRNTAWVASAELGASWPATHECVPAAAVVEGDAQLTPFQTSVFTASAAVPQTSVPALPALFHTKSNGLAELVLTSLSLTENEPSEPFCISAHDRSSRSSTWHTIIWSFAGLGLGLTAMNIASLPLAAFGSTVETDDHDEPLHVAYAIESAPLDAKAAALALPGS